MGAGAYVGRGEDADGVVRGVGGGEGAADGEGELEAEGRDGCAGREGVTGDDGLGLEGVGYGDEGGIGADGVVSL